MPSNDTSADKLTEILTKLENSVERSTRAQIAGRTYSNKAIHHYAVQELLSWADRRTVAVLVRLRKHLDVNLLDLHDHALTIRAIDTELQDLKKAGQQ